MVWFGVGLVFVAALAALWQTWAYASWISVDALIVDFKEEIEPESGLTCYVPIVQLRDIRGVPVWVTIAGATQLKKIGGTIMVRHPPGMPQRAGVANRGLFAIYGVLAMIGVFTIGMAKSLQHHGVIQ